MSNAKAWREGVTVVQNVLVSTDAPLNSDVARARLQHSSMLHTIRSLSGSACRRCRRRKIRCGGGEPCHSCGRANSACIYDAVEGSDKPARLAVAPLAPSPMSLDTAPSLLHGFMRAHYLEVFFRQRHCILPLLQRDGQAGPARGVSGQLEEMVALAYAARALEHHDVCQQLVHKGQCHATQLIENGDASAARGVFMLGYIQLNTGNNAVAEYYISAANRLAPKAPHTPIVAMIMDRIRSASMAKDSVAESMGLVPLKQAVPFRSHPTDQSEIFEFGKGMHPLLVELGKALQQFPRRNAVVDAFNEVRFLGKQATPRADAFIPSARVEIMLRCLHLGEASVVGDALSRDLPLDALLTRFLQRRTIQWGLHMLVCTIGGMVTLGCHYVVQAIECLKRMRGPMMGFYIDHLIPPVYAIAAFLSIYRENIQIPETSYQSLLLELSDIIRPMAHFETLGKLIPVIEADLADARAVALAPSPDDVVVSARWLTPERFPRDTDELLHQLRDLHAREMATPVSIGILDEACLMELSAAGAATDAPVFDVPHVIDACPEMLV